MRIKFWGVRGSIPHSLDSQGWVSHIESVMKDFFARGYKSATDIQKFLASKDTVEIGGFGVATTCVQISSGDDSIIIDGGSGLKAVGDNILNSSTVEQKEFHILISHFHFDHIMGLPFFMPHYNEGCIINYYSAHDETETVIKSLFQKPMFPVSFGSLQAEIKFHRVEAYKTSDINGFKVTPYKTDHPDLCFGFRVEKNNRRYAHAVDNEAVRTTPQDLGLDAGLYEKADLLYFDAQYDERDLVDKKGWGHGSSHRGFEICRHFNIQQVLFAHHDPSFSIEDSLRQQNITEKNYKEKYADLKINWRYAYDGLVVEL